MVHAKVLMWVVAHPAMPQTRRFFGALEDGTVFGEGPAGWGLLHRENGSDDDAIAHGLQIMAEAERHGYRMLIDPVEFEMDPAIAGDIRADRNWSANAVALMMGLDMAARRSGGRGLGIGGRNGNRPPNGAGRRTRVRFR